MLRFRATFTSLLFLCLVRRFCRWLRFRFCGVFGWRFAALCEQACVSRLVEADDQGTTGPQARGPKVTRRSHKQASQSICIGLVLGHHNVHHLLALGGIDFIDAFCQRDRLRGGDGRFFCIHLLGSSNAVSRKKLLRMTAGLSVRPMIAPVYFHHDDTLLLDVMKTFDTPRTAPSPPRAITSYPIAFVPERTESGSRCKVAATRRGSPRTGG